MRACDEPPLLVLLNSCNSAAQLRDLVRDEIPLAIGMADEIDEGDAITYAAQFYAAVATSASRFVFSAPRRRLPNGAATPHNQQSPPLSGDLP